MDSDSGKPTSSSPSPSPSPSPIPSSESTSSSSSSLLSRRKQAIIARSMAEIERQLDQWLDNDVVLRHHQGGVAKRAVKRARARDDEGDDENGYNSGVDDFEGGGGGDGGGYDDTEKKKKGKKRARHEILRFACPFAKHNPVRFRNVKTCCGPGWVDPHRVKEHVYRRHSLKNACNRCFESFDDPKGLKEHQRSKTPCRLRDSAPTHVISDEQEEQLRARAKPNSSATEKWQDMYRIIFPGVPVPSPYYDATDEDIIAKAESQSSFKDVDEYKAHFKREVLRTVKPVLEAELEKLLQTASAALRQTANTLLRDLHGRIVRTWQFQSEQAAVAAREPTPSPEPEEDQDDGKGDVVDPICDFNQVITTFEGDPLFSALVPGEEFNLDFLMGSGGAAGEQQLLVDCGASVPDSAYFSGSLDSSGTWVDSSY
ncbi:hypothetical protein QBC47DRAFT_218003 [Echria macrotheca]|uniref:C2H2-type domain-containing protein n=1 Tax=Echria macrotheca TaxID=438768 RepID=A0AAJ0F4B4_9PEZI|nr:hypothetical protein QBC47DRAFT_218003 [Echria macrotheca]